MRIVHLLPGLTKGGGERVAADLANHQAAAGHEVAILVGFEADAALLAASLDPSIRVRLIARAGRGRLSQYREGLAWVWRNRAWLRDQDVVHCHLTYGAVIGTFIRLLRRWKGAPRPIVVETYHAVGMPMSRPRRWLAARFASYRDGLILMAEDGYWCRFRQKHPQLLVRTILNGVSPPGRVSAGDAPAFRKSLAIPEDVELIVGTIGALREERRTEAFIPVFEEMSRRLGRSAHFLIGGEGPARNRVEEAIRTSSIAERVHLAGLVQTPADVLALLDLYVTLNVGSTTGIAALEAAMAGVPVLALQLVEGYAPSEHDWIWSTSDQIALGERAAALLVDHSARRALAERQQAHAMARHSVPVMAAEYMRFYHEAAARCGNSVSGGLDEVGP